MAGAASWAAALGVLASTGLLDARLSLSCAFFVVLFGVLAVAYQRTVIVVGEDALELRGLLGPHVIPLRLILRVDVARGPFRRRYDVVSTRGTVRFTSLFEGHERLGALIADRAGARA